MSCSELRYWLNQSLPLEDLPTTVRDYNKFYVSTIGKVTLSKKLDEIKVDNASIFAGSYIKAYLNTRGIETGDILPSAFIRFSFPYNDIPNILLKEHVLLSTFTKYGENPIEFIPILVFFSNGGHSMMLVLDNINKKAQLLDINGPYAIWSTAVEKVLYKNLPDYNIEAVEDICPVQIPVTLDGGICAAWSWFILMMRLACNQRTTKRVVSEFLRLSEDDQRRALLTFIIRVYEFKKMIEAHW